MASVFGFVHRNWQLLNPPVVPKTDDALKFGILGAANIAPMALIGPAKSHPDVVVQAVAARDKSRAEAYAKKHGIPQVLDSYQAVLDDPSIDAVYIPLPNGLHYEWALKALAKGKHVLLEKPSTSNAEEAAALFRSPLLKRPGAPVLLEAFHYRFQPAWQCFLSLIDRPSVEHVRAVTRAPALAFRKDDIRFRYGLAGGALMDLGTYHASILRGVFGAEPEECLACSVETMAPPHDELCDHTFRAMYRFPNGGTGEIDGSLQAPLLRAAFPRVEVTHRPVVVADGAEGLPEGQEKTRARKVSLANFMVANVWHRIDVEDEYVVRKKHTGEVVRRWREKQSRKAYTFREAGVDGQPDQEYWLSYRYQLEEFVNRVRGREGSGRWVSGEDSVAQMRMLDMTYEKSGLPLRRTSAFRLDAGGDTQAV